MTYAGQHGDDKEAFHLQKQAFSANIFKDQHSEWGEDGYKYK